MSVTHRIAPGASRDRLEQLIGERVRPGADTAAIDRKIWDMFGEDWAVMFTDLSGFSRRVAEFGIIHFLQTIHESHRLLVPCIDAHCGILLKLEGDSMLVLFRKADIAVDCAIAMQASVAEWNVSRNPEDQVLLCIGIGYGRVLRIGDVDVYGEEVNSASKLGEDHAGPGDVLVTGALHDQLENPAQFAFEPFKGPFAHSPQAYRVTLR